MQLFRTEMLFLHPPQPVVPPLHYGRRRGSASHYGHAHVRPQAAPSRPAPPAAMPDPLLDPSLDQWADQPPGRVPEPAHDPALDLERAA